MTDSIENLVSDPKNARRRTSRSTSLIQKSLKQFGAARSIVIDENNRILAGNGTVEGAKAAGIENLRVIETDGKEIIAVKRTGLSEKEKVGLALADNRTSELSEWDMEMLHSLSEEMDTSPWFSEDDLNELFFKEEDLAEDQSETITENFHIMIQCTDEIEQSAALETLLKQGFKCRVLNS